MTSAEEWQDPRRLARSIAFQTLFEVDSVGHPPESTLARHLAEAALVEAASAFARELVQGVVANLHPIDDILAAAAPAWPIEQISAVDRNVLRLAIFEILFNNRVSVKVAINEAVELAKTFGSESSPRFVNGVLGTVAAKKEAILEEEAS